MPTSFLTRTTVALLAIGLTAGSAACGGADNGGTVVGGPSTSTSSTSVAGGTQTSTAKSEATDKVLIKDFTFTPGTATVKVGDTVTWSNQDGFEHSVVADDKSFISEKFKGQPFSHQFSTPGTFSYICGVHNYMTGTIVVS